MANGGGKNGLGGKSFMGTKDIGGVSSGSDGGGGFSQRGAHRPEPVVRDGMHVKPSRSGPSRGGKVK
jgi:hypothetical protein